MADPRVSQIETLWSVVRQAHSDESAETSTARSQLIEHELIDLNLWQYRQPLMRPRDNDE